MFFGGYQTFTIKNSATFGKFGYYISGGYLESDGYCDVVEKKRKPYHTEKEVERHNIGGKLTYEVDPSSSFALSSSHYRQEDTGRYKIPGYEVTSEQNRVGLNYQKKGEGWNLRANLYKNNDESFFTSPYYDSANKTYNAIKYNSYNEQETFGGTIQTSINLTKNNILTIGSDYKRGEIDRRDEYLTETRDIKVKGKQEYIALFVQDEINLGDKLSVILGGRYDWWESFDGYGYDDNASPKEADYPEKSDESFNPKVGVNYYLTDSTTLRGSAGTAFRAPYPFQPLQDIRRCRQHL